MDLGNGLGYPPAGLLVGRQRSGDPSFPLRSSWLGLCILVNLILVSGVIVKVVVIMIL
jgi:hypothetical protein